MNVPRLLIVDDDERARFLMKEALATGQYDVETAAGGEDALQQLTADGFALVLLDLSMPGMGGLDLLRRISESRPDIRVIIVSGHGTLHDAVETTRLGAVDYIEKPFVPDELRRSVARVLDRQRIKEETAASYADHMQLAARCASDRNFEAATEHVRQAIALDSSRPDAFNTLGVLLEVTGQKLQAQKNYRVALNLDPTYKPAQANLKRTVGG